MANVLGTLFGDIANAIRGKTGGTDKMSPADFPSQIDSIVVGGGSGETGKQLLVNSGSVTIGSADVTVNHGLGVTPDIILYQSGGTFDSGTAHGYYKSIQGVRFSQAFVDSYNNKETPMKNWNYGFLAGVFKIANQTTTQSTFSFFFSGVDVEDTRKGVGVKDANETSFTVEGTTNMTQWIGSSVSWFAIGGITG